MVFLDTVGLLAVWDRRDQWHVAAKEAFARVQASQSDLLSTSYVLAECANAATRKPYRLEVDALRDRLEEEGTLIMPTPDDWRSAWDGYRHGEAGLTGVVDHLSFAVMRRLGLTRAFTNDQHFQAAGFEILFSR